MNSTGAQTLGNSPKFTVIGFAATFTPHSPRFQSLAAHLLLWPCVDKFGSLVATFRQPWDVPKRKYTKIPSLREAMTMRIPRYTEYIRKIWTQKGSSIIWAKKLPLPSHGLCHNINDISRPYGLSIIQVFLQFPPQKILGESISFEAPNSRTPRGAEM